MNANPTGIVPRRVEFQRLPPPPRPTIYTASIAVLFPPPPGFGKPTKHRGLELRRARRWRRQCEEAAGVLLMELQALTRFPAPVVMLDKAPYGEAQAYYIQTHFFDPEKAVDIQALLSRMMERWPVIANWETGPDGETLRTKLEAGWPGELSERERKRRAELSRIRSHETKGVDDDWRNVGKPWRKAKR